MLKEEYKKLKVLYVEDEDFIRENAVSYLKRFFENVYEANDAFTALDRKTETSLSNNRYKNAKIKWFRYG